MQMLVKMLSRCVPQHVSLPDLEGTNDLIVEVEGTYVLIKHLQDTTGRAATC
jgi:hypothetical protein